MDPPSPSTTFQVDKSTRLILNKNSLKISNGHRARRNITRPCCCGLLSQKVAEPNKIDFHHILDATISSKGLTITYVDTHNVKSAPVNALQYSVGADQEEQATLWVEHLLELAYGSAQRRKRLKVLINSFCASALSKYHNFAAPIFAAAHCDVDVEETRYRGHAGEIAETIDLDAYDAIVCCSGDGLPHEVFNGLARRADAVLALSSVAVAMFPCGSGNALAWNVFGTDDPVLAALEIVKALVKPLDLCSITQGDRHTVSFLSQALGVLADCDLKTEHLRWMGDTRFLYGVLATISRNTKYPCQLAFKPTMGRADHIESGTPTPQGTKLPLKYGTVLDGIPDDWEVQSRERLASFYASQMPIVAKDTNFFPDASPSDGAVDLMIIDETIGYAGAIEAIIRLPQGKCHELKHVEMKKVSAYRLTPTKLDGEISVDGERYPFEPFQVEIHRGLGRVLSKSAILY